MCAQFKSVNYTKELQLKTNIKPGLLVMCLVVAQT